MLDRKYTHFPANGIRYAAIRCFTKEPHRGDNYFTLFAILAFQRKKQVIRNPYMYKNRQHPTDVECRLFCCPILLGRCRFCSFLKLLSYRHMPYAHTFARVFSERLVSHFDTTNRSEKTDKYFFARRNLSRGFLQKLQIVQ